MNTEAKRSLSPLAIHPNHKKTQDVEKSTLTTKISGMENFRCP